MRYDRLFSALYCEPLLLDDRARIGFERALAAFMASSQLPTPEARKLPDEARARRSDRILEVRGQDAVVHLDGPLGKHLSMMDMVCFGGTDLHDVDQVLAQVAATPSVQNVLLAFNSPGGVVTGVPETAARVAELARSKNVFAFTDGDCCSAAYYIASQADQVFATPSSRVGSIGVYCALLDESRKLENEGTKVNFLKSGKFKGMGASFQPLAEDARKLLQDEVDKIGAMFRSAVRAARPQVEDGAMEGQWFFGDDSLKAGLVDAIVPDLPAALAEFYPARG